MNKRVVSLGLVTALSLGGLTGCGSSKDIAQLNNIKALNTESTVSTSNNLSVSEKEDIVYAKVVERQLLNLSNLDECSANEKQQVLQFMNSVDAQLTGQLSPKEGVIDEAYTNYLLMEFEKTPYYWQRVQTAIRGIDAESRSIVVDVTYNTIDYKKSVQKASYLTVGEPDYDQKMQIRYTRWMQILESKYRSGIVDWKKKYKEFEKVYGKPQEIFESQRNLTLTNSIYNSGNQLTYSGLVNSVEENNHATMTIRYVLTPSFTLGINTGMTCSHMYRVSYSLNNDCTEGFELFKDEGYATISDNIYKLVYSYFTAIDESDFTGLYTLTKNFEDLDKYYSDYFETTYRKHDGFTVSLFDISGTKVKCGVSISSKTRAKGSNVSSPLYEDRYYMELELIDDALKVTNMVLLSSTLEGEPAISIKDAQTSGFTSGIDLDIDDKKSIEHLIADFGAAQLMKDTTSDSFGDIIDTSISQNQLGELKKNMTSIEASQKVVWLLNYMQGTSNYASVRCKELFQKKDNSIIEADVMYNFINKGGTWYIYSYDINSSVALDTTNLNTTGSLCTCTKGKVKKLNSQVTETESLQGVSSESGDKIGTVYTHETYKPVKKKEIKEKGLVKLTVKDLSDSKFKSLYSELVESMSLDTQYSDLEKMRSACGGSADSLLKEVVCFYFNYINSRYMNAIELNEVKDKLAPKLESAISNTTSNEEAKQVLTSILDWVKGSTI